MIHYEGLKTLEVKGMIMGRICVKMHILDANTAEFFVQRPVDSLNFPVNTRTLCIFFFIHKKMRYYKNVSELNIKTFK